MARKGTIAWYQERLDVANKEKTYWRKIVSSTSAAFKESGVCGDTVIRGQDLPTMVTELVDAVAEMRKTICDYKEGAMTRDIYIDELEDSCQEIKADAFDVILALLKDRKEGGD